ncbi:MAG: peptidoglycan editing factor PgeF [Clostridia bacterium]|nr:peptidoglycan editing factor PgeF [Clostridia bacterium]
MNDFYYRETDGVVTLHCRALDSVPGVRHCFTTRRGGVSEGYLATMNLSFSREDKENVTENWRRLCKAEGFCFERMTLTDQTHTTFVRLVDERTAGMGIAKDSDIKDIDGLMTCLPETPLAVFVADCAPILLCDRVGGAVAAVHSGWRGTHGGIAAKALQKMKEQFGTEAKNVIAVLGPCICQNCYEVGQDFKDAFADWDAEHLFIPKGEKYHFDLKGANRQVLERAGVEEIYITDECTSCNPDLLFSHRATGGKRGNMAGIIQLTGNR